MSFESDYIADEPVRLTGEQQKTVNAVAQLLEDRHNAYARVFRSGGSTDGDVKIVMDDLARFCRAFASTHHDNDRHAARLDGRREVFLRIMEMSRLPHDVLFDYYHRRQT